MRRAPRPVNWLARLLWLPMVAVGLPLLLHVTVDFTKVRPETWRVLVSIPPPMDWVAHPATFWPGLLLLVLGLVAFALQGTRGLRVAAYMPLAAAAWLFFLIAVLTTWRFEAFVAQLQQGLDWRFLAHLRTTWIDRTVLVVSLAAGIACWIASWGSWPGEARERQQARRSQQGPAQPATE